MRLMPGLQTRTGRRADSPRLGCLPTPIRPGALLLAAALLLVFGFAWRAPEASADVAHRATSCNHNESGGSLVVTKPAGTVADDILIATAVENDTGNISPPAGWTSLQSNQPDAASWYKVAGGSEPASYTFSTPSGDTFGVIISAFSGGDTASPIAGSAKSSGTSSSIALPNTTATRNGSMRWSSVAHSPSNNVSSSWSGGMTEACDRAGNDAGVASAYQTQASGATPARTATLGSSEPFWAYTAVVNAALPEITSISPTAGPTAGGQTVTITGQYFTGATSVTFGGTAGTSVTVVNDSTITVVTPARAIGTVEVRVTTTPGTSVDAGAVDNYTYQAPPTVTSISPAAGPTAGGTSVTITGTNFTGLSGAAAVQFGGTNASSYTVNSATSITATAPARAAGVADVRVTTPGGTSANTAADDYTYYAPPTITSISPAAGPTAGGTSVVIIGTNFGGLSGASAVVFGATNATSYTVDSATQITATAPAGTGTQDVRVTTPGGTTANTAADNYTYYAPPTITSISPATGPATGGTSVTITGTNFAGLSGASAVVFGGTNATSYTVNSATSITATAPAGTGTQNVRVTTPGGTSANTAADDYVYVPAPTVTSLSPSAGPTAGGTSVTITGTNFTGATQVQFGGTNATGYTVDSATQITATAPAGAAGTVDVRVMTIGGTSANTAADNYTYHADPTVASLSPTQGPESGGTSVTITGTNFTGLSGAAAVQFGGTNATSYVVNSATSITATAPAGTGAVSVRVTTPGGTTANTAADDYTYVPLPTVTNVSPSAGPTGGANTVTITGTNFSGASQVRFGATDATGYSIVNATTITATVPAGTGTQDVRVTTVGGTSANTAADDYTYYAAPTVASISPMSGPAPGGTSVTITGTNFAGLSGASAVQFGGVNASGYSVVNSTTITATAPPGSGTVDVRVTTPGGTTPNTAADDFTYIPAPTITSLSPTQGPESGANTVTITGTTFTGATAVDFGGTSATGYTVVNATTITATAPAGTGTVSVRVTTPSGTSANTAADDYTYVPAPTVTNLSPNAGPNAGANTVTITGTNFTGASAVDFGGTSATGYTVVNATTITATAPAGTGTVNVRVTTVGGTSANTAADDYTYYAAPTITSISPMSGPAPGGTSVTITGTGFTGLSGASAVQFGGVNATGYSVVNSTTITATAPPGTGTVDVRVTNPGGTSANTAADDFTYIPAPTVVSLSPTSGPQAGGTTVTITGTHFTGATQVTFGGTDATGYTVVNATTITATAPPGTPGSADVRVTTPSGTSANTAADDYTYIATPTVTGLSPSSGATAGGTTVTITGTGFTGTTQVQFGGVNATGFTVVNATTITATAPAGTGVVNVRVTAPGGTSANTGDDDYAYLDPPVVSSISPSTGPATGGTVVTITGSFLTGATGVTFGGVNATSFTVVNATTITATAPAGSGVVSVQVTTADGTSANTAADDFTYVDAPTVTSLSPTSGPDVGGTSVTITGTNFTGATQVTFGGTSAVGFTVDSATQITATSPTHAVGLADVRVTTEGGVSANTAADDYEFLAACGLGGLTVSATDFSFTPLTMNGLDQIHSTTTTVQVSDMTGSGAGWKLEVGTTQFTAGPGQTLPATAARITGATATPQGGSCSAPTSNVSAYPVPLPISPAKAKVYNAEVNTGRGPVDVEFGVDLDVPADTEAGTYTSTWTIDLSAAP